MKFKNILFIGGFLLLFGSCDDALEVQNPNSLSSAQVLSSISGFEALTFSAYEYTHDFTFMGRDGIIEPEVMADQLDFNNRTGRFETDYVNAVRSHMARWNRYRPINDANTVLALIDDLEGLTAEEATLRERLKGEAYFIRALNYHELARVYGYEPGREQSGFNLTTPLILTPTLGVSDALNLRPRATNTEMYAQIKSDLTDAIALLDNTAGLPNRATKAAAQALMARVLLYEGKYPEAAAMANTAITTSGISLADSMAYVNSWGISPGHPEAIFEADIRAVDWSTVDGANNSLNALSNNTNAGAQFILVGSPELMTVVDRHPNDSRSALWSDPGGLVVAGSRKCNKWQGESGDFRENIPVIRISEMYLTAAEGFARSNQDVAARTALNAFLTARNVPTTMASGAALIDIIMEERRLEFAFEGHRWFDLKRLGMDVPKTAASQQPTLSASDFRILGVIPESELSLNDLLVQNPGY